MTPDGIDRIVEAVGRWATVPVDLDREELDDDLRHAWIQYQAGSWARAGSSRARRDLEQVATTAARLRDSLTETMPLRRGTRSHKAALDCLIEDVQQVLGGPRFQAPVVGEGPPPARVYLKERQHGDKLSAFEWLVGAVLPKIFRRHFGIEAKLQRTTNNQAAHGPYVSFCLQALIELGITGYTDEAVARALSKAKACSSFGQSSQK
jgi:hypothetical protein